MLSVVKACREPSVRFLFNRGVLTEMANEDGQTVLLLARSALEQSVVRRLLEHGVEIQQIDAEGNTALV